MLMSHDLKKFLYFIILTTLALCLVTLKDDVNLMLLHIFKIGLLLVMIEYVFTFPFFEQLAE